MRFCCPLVIVGELSLKQLLSLQPLSLLLTPLVLSRRAVSGWDRDAPKGKGKKGKLSDSQSRAVTGMEEYEAADVIQVSKYTNKLLR